MKYSRPTANRIGLLLYSAGALLAFTFIALVSWADVEAQFYGFPRLGNKAMSGLSCPPLMTTAAGNDRFTITLANTTQQPIRPVLRADISNTGLWRTYTTPVEMAPGERKKNTWEVGTEDVVLDHYIFIKAYTYASYPLPDSEGTCGIFVANIPWISGSQLTGLWITAGVILLVLGLWLSRAQADVNLGKPTVAPARWAMAGMAAAGLLASISGWWLVGILMLALMVLTLSVMVVAALGN